MSRLVDRDVFAKNPTYSKWVQLSNMMNEISQTDAAFSMRRRLNPHHPKDQIKEETRNFRIQQYTKWSEVKDLYAEFRDELSNTFEVPLFQYAKEILEKIFTNDLDEELQKVLND